LLWQRGLHLRRRLRLCGRVRASEQERQHNHTSQIIGTTRFHASFRSDEG